MKKSFLFSLIAIIILIAWPLRVSATEGDEVKYSYGNFYYHLHDGYVSICGYLGNDEEIIIPSSIAGKPVAEIEGLAFTGCDSIRIIIIPDTVEKVYDNSFAQMSSLCRIISNASGIEIHAGDGIEIISAQERQDVSGDGANPDNGEKGQGEKEQGEKVQGEQAQGEKGQGEQGQEEQIQGEKGPGEQIQVEQDGGDKEGNGMRGDGKEVSKADGAGEEENEADDAGEEENEADDAGLEGNVEIGEMSFVEPDDQLEMTDSVDDENFISEEQSVMAEEKAVEGNEVKDGKEVKDEVNALSLMAACLLIGTVVVVVIRGRIKK